MSTRFMQHDGGEIAYDDQGHGPVIVCVPGMGDLRAEYRYLAPQLSAAGYRVVTMDVRGHGETSVKWADFSVGSIGTDITALIKHLDAGPAIVIGTSMAAGAAVCAAVESPDSVRSLVLIGPAVRDGSVSQWQRDLLYGALFAQPWGVAMWALYFPKLFPTQKPPDFEWYLKAIKSNLHEQGRMSALRKMMIASKKASEDGLDRVKAPVLILMGSRDPDFKDPKAEADFISSHVYGTVHMVEGAGHYPHVEMPEPTGRLVVSCLTTREQVKNVA